MDEKRLLHVTIGRNSLGCSPKMKFLSLTRAALNVVERASSTKQVSTAEMNFPSPMKLR